MSIVIENDKLRVIHYYYIRSPLLLLIGVLFFIFFYLDIVVNANPRERSYTALER